MAGFLQRERIVAPPGWSRWLMPPAALSIHLAIGQAYAWSVFKPPLEAGLDISGAASALPFTLGIIMLGLSAAVFGTKVDATARAGRCWCRRLLRQRLPDLRARALPAQYWLVVVGYGFVGGIGLGIGYISPVSTLIKWFPDRPGLSTGIAIMGFGGGALIASPLTQQLLAAFGDRRQPGRERDRQTFLVMGVMYAVFMSVGWLLIRVPADDWKPAGWEPAQAKRTLITTANVSAANAIKTPQFWLLWVVLCFNVTAGIGILESGRADLPGLLPGRLARGAGRGGRRFVAMLSLANWRGPDPLVVDSDFVGRKNMYRIYLGVGALLYLGSVR